MSKYRGSIMHSVAITALVFGSLLTGAGLQPVLATDVCGDVCNETWDLPGSPYTATCDVTVPATCSLIIEAGVEVRFQAGRRFEVYGQLGITGTAGSEVVLQSASATPEPGDWAGLHLGPGSEATLRHVRILHGQHGILASDTITTLLDNVTASENHFGLTVAGTSSVDASWCTFADNSSYGVGLQSPVDQALTITRSSIHGNGGYYDFDASGTTRGQTFLARENWWGNADSAAIKSRIASGDGSVDWCGYLDRAPDIGVPARDAHCPELWICDGTAVWDLTDKPYQIVSSVYVCPTGTLEIGPGVDVRAVQGVSIGVEGALQVNGTAGSPVSLTSDAAVQTIGDWGGLHLTEGGTATIDHAEITYADAGLSLSGLGNAYMNHVTLRWNDYGLNFVCTRGLCGESVIQLDGCTLIDNASFAIHALGNSMSSVAGPSTTLSGSTIHSNGGGTDVSAAGFARLVIDARGNWWNTVDPLEIEARFPTLLAVNVNWCGWLDNAPPVGSPVRTDHCPDLDICDESAMWDATDEPYLLVSDLVICHTGTLTIGPGVVVRALVSPSSLAITVHGELDVNGELASPVSLLSDAAASLAGDWSGVMFRPGSIGTIDHATIFHATWAVRASQTANVALNGVTAQENQIGLYINGYEPMVVNASGCTFTHNQQYGIEIHNEFDIPDPAVSITGSSIHSNLGGHDLFVNTDFETPESTVIEARGNWWGDDDTTAIANRIHDRDDHAAAARVEWCAYLDGPGGTAPDVECPQTWICDRTVVWDRTDRPYQLTGDMYICPTGVLQVEAGVQVRMVRTSPAIEFRVDGRLEVNGTPVSPVRFTSDSVTPAAGDWTGLLFVGVLPSSLSHATVEYGSNGIYTDDDNTLTLNDVTLRYNQTGLRARSIDGRPTVTADECRIIENAGDGIYVYNTVSYAHPLVTIHRSEIHSNLGSRDFTSGAMSSAHRRVYDFRENWWGSADPADFGPRILDYRINDGRPLVDTCRYLDGPGGDPVVDAHCPDLAVCDETVTLDLTDKPYQVTSDMYVCSTGTLSVDPGVTVMAAAGIPPSDIQIHGALDVNGTAAAPVVFTSDAPDPQPGDWSSLYLASSSTSTIDHAEISHAVYGVQVTDSAFASLTDVRSYQNIDGVYVYGYGPPSAVLDRCELVDNDRYGVHVNTYTGRPNPQVTVNRSSLHSNRGAYDYYFYPATAPTRTVVNARENWWGDPEQTAIGPRIYDHRARDGSPIVDWCGYLDGPGGNPVQQTHCPDLAPCDETVILDQTDLPYLLTSDMIVCDTGTLQIEPGVEVRTVLTSPKPDFLVEGTLDINGTTESEVLLTSNADTPQSLDWGGVWLAGSAAATIDHAIVTYADDGIRVDNSADATLTGVTSRLNHTGLYVGAWGPPSATANGCTFIENDTYGVQAYTVTGRPNPTVIVNGSSIHGNGAEYDFYFYPATNATETVIDARGNYWGNIEQALIGPRIYDHRTRDGAPIVDWCGYLDGHDGDPVRQTHCPDLAPCDETVVLDKTDLPYLLTSDMIVCDTGILQIEPGVEVRTVLTTPEADFLVEGTLDVNGTRASPVTLTTDSTAPQVGDWYGVVLGAGSIGTLDHTEIVWADRGIEVTDDATAALEGVTLRRNFDGLFVQGHGAQTVTASGCSFTENDRSGIWTRRILGYPNPDIAVTRSAIHSNLGNDIYANDYAAPATAIIWATDNWWGTVDDDEIEAMIYDHDDDGSAPHIYFEACGETCDMALGRDRDVDGLPDFDDNCPDVGNASQVDGDHDGMGDPCDPEPATVPWDDCDGFEDMLDGYADADGDGWGDPCDHHPLRDDSYPGAPELCDARDNDGDGFLGLDERTDEDMDLDVACGDCDDLEPLANVCLCEVCGNGLDDDCDGLADGGDVECVDYPSCVVVETGADPWLNMGKGECGGATLSGPYDVIRGHLAELAFDTGHVDLGAVSCVAGGLDWDRTTDWSLNPNPRCEAVPVLFYVGRNTGDSDFGTASSGEPRDTMTPDPVCP